MRRELPRWSIDLSRPAPDRLETLFGSSVREVWVEIGFGGGEHLVAQAMAHPAVGFIGCEPFQDGVLKVLNKLEQGGVGNVRLHPDDARPLLRWLPAASVGGVFVLFPDPWPKKRHAKRRLVNEHLIRDLGRCIRAGGELRLATDDADYAEAMDNAVRSFGANWTATLAVNDDDRPADWPATRYESKARAAGRKCRYMAFRLAQNRLSSGH